MVMAGSTGREVDIAGYGWDGGGGGYSVWLKWPNIAICVPVNISPLRFIDDLLLKSRVYKNKYCDRLFVFHCDFLQKSR